MDHETRPAGRAVAIWIVAVVLVVLNALSVLWGGFLLCLIIPDIGYEGERSGFAFGFFLAMIALPVQVVLLAVTLALVFVENRLPRALRMAALRLILLAAFLDVSALVISYVLL